MNQAGESIAVFGEALVDDFTTSQVVGGAPFNVARHLAAFGAAPRVFTRIGNDADGALVRAQFARFGLSEAGLQIDPARATGRVLVEQRGGTHLFVILPDQAWDHVEAAPLLAALDTSAAQLLYFGTLAQRAPATRAALASLLAATSAPRFLDLNLRAGQVTPACVLASLHEADVAKVNEDELCWLHKALGHAGAPPADLSTPAAAAACAGLVRLFGLRALVVTAGERGAWYVGADGTYLHAAAGPVARFADTVGAGDAFAAVFMLGSVRGWPPALTLERAVDFASAICAVPGAVPADPQFYAPWRARWLAGFH